MKLSIKERVFALLEVAHADDKSSKYFDIFILSLITINGVSMILETVIALGQQFQYFFWLIEAISVPIFTIEYVARIWACTADPRHPHPFFGRIRYALRPLTIIDLLAILPFYLTFLKVDFRVIRVLRIFRILRLAKLTRYSTAIWTFYRVFMAKKDELAIALTTIGILLVLASTFIYYAEHTVQPDKFSSIPAAMYWGVMTITTVGYGDIVPITTVGKLLGSLTGLLGIAIFAIPAGILASGFAQEIKKRTEPFQKCPHCGEIIDRRKKGPRAK